MPPSTIPLVPILFRFSQVNGILTIHQSSILLRSSYTDERRHHSTLGFEKGGHIYLYVFPTIGVQRSGIKRELIMYYFGPYKIVENSDLVSHIQLENYLKSLANIIINDVALLEVDLSYPEHPVKLLDQQDRVMRRKTIGFLKTIKFYKVQWSYQLKR
jgi:hypothetical protein